MSNTQASLQRNSLYNLYWEIKIVIVEDICYFKKKSNW